MALSDFAPKVWGSLLLQELQNQAVYANLTNRDYEGDIQNCGDTVKINTLQPITLTTYTPNTDIAAPQLLDLSQKELKIDQANAFNFQIDDVDNVRSYPKLMEQALVESAYALSNAVDVYLAGLHTDIANTLGTDAAPLTLGPTSAYKAIVDAKVMLDSQNVPHDGRFIVVPPWFHGLLLMNDMFVGGSDTARETLGNGYIGTASGFNIYVSNNVPNDNGNAFKVIAGYPGAWSYAEQILRTEHYRLEKRFADAVKGLHVFGAKVTRPDKMVVMTANPAEGAGEYAGEGA